MAAYVDKTRKHLLPREYRQQPSWLLCRHLSDAEKVYLYYMNSGPIVIYLGKCVCKDCFDALESMGTIFEMLDACRSVSDQEFQYEFVDPLILANKMHFGCSRHLAQDGSNNRWRSCAHLTGCNGLQEIYSTYEAIFIHKGSLTCDRCRKVEKGTPLGPPRSMRFSSLSDEHFRNRIVARLIPLNHRMLETEGKIGSQRV
jgi:hypothetical protein